jgi:hypothetical protein
VARPEERQIRHDDDGRPGTAAREDGERAIDDRCERARGCVAQRHRAVLASGGHDVVTVGGDQHAVDGGGAHRDGDDAIEERTGHFVATAARGDGEARLPAGEAARRHDSPRPAQAHRCERRADHPSSSSAKAITSPARRIRSSRVFMIVRVDSVTARVVSSPCSITIPVMTPA